MSTVWYEANGLETEAFHHAAAANDIERAERLIEGGRMPLHSLGVVTAILDWLDSLPKTVLDVRPRLWVRSATSTLMAGRTTGVEEKLQAAEKAMQNADPDDKTRDLIGQIGRWGLLTSSRGTAPRPVRSIPKPYPSDRRPGIST